MGPQVRHPGCRRSRRQRGVGLRHGHGEARPRLRLARHVGRAFRRQRRLSAQPRKRGAHVLPCAAEHLAPDGRHPVGDGFAELAVRNHRQERGRPDRRTRRQPQGAERRDLPALSLGRAHAAQRRRHPRLLHRARPRSRPGDADAGRARGRRPSRSATAWRRCAPPARNCRASRRSAAARARATGCSRSPPRSACRSTFRPTAISARPSAQRGSG